MNWKMFGLFAGLLASLNLVSCSTTPNTQPPDAMKDKSAVTVKNDAMKDKSANAMKNDAMTKSRSGSFVSGEHPTNGKASIIQENGTYFIEFSETFKTDSGPDLFVILHRSPEISKISQPPNYGIAEGDYVTIAPLKNINGKQRYQIPQNIQLDNYKSVAVWCRKFNATFGFAPLSGV